MHDLYLRDQRCNGWLPAYRLHQLPGQGCRDLCRWWEGQPCDVGDDGDSWLSDCHVSQHLHSQLTLAPAFATCPAQTMLLENQPTLVASWQFTGMHGRDTACTCSAACCVACLHESISGRLHERGVEGPADGQHGHLDGPCCCCQPLHLQHS